MTTPEMPVPLVPRLRLDALDWLVIISAAVCCGLVLFDALGLLPHARIEGE